MTMRAWMVAGGCALLGVVFGAMVPTAVAQAPASARQCDYTFIEDSGEPNIGKNGEIKYNDSWSAVVQSGWTLKSSSTVGSTVMYLFEKCR